MLCPLEALVAKMDASWKAPRHYRRSSRASWRHGKHYRRSSGASCGPRKHYRRTSREPSRHGKHYRQALERPADTKNITAIAPDASRAQFQAVHDALRRLLRNSFRLLRDTLRIPRSRERVTSFRGYLFLQDATLLVAGRTNEARQCPT